MTFRLPKPSVTGRYSFRKEESRPVDPLSKSPASSGGILRWNVVSRAADWRLLLSVFGGGCCALAMLRPTLLLCERNAAARGGAEDALGSACFLTGSTAVRGDVPPFEFRLNLADAIFNLLLFHLVSDQSHLQSSYVC